MNLSRSTFRSLEFLIDRLLDPVFAGTDLRDRLAGHSLIVEITDLGYSFLLTFHQLGVHLDPASGKRGDLVIRGTRGDFAARIRGLEEPALRFEGDLGFAQTLGDLVRHLPRERDSWLKAILGDWPARCLSRTLDHGSPFSRKIAAKLAGFARSGLERTGFGISLEHFSAWQSTLRELAVRLDTLENLARSGQRAGHPPP